MVLSVFSCIYWPFVYHWINVFFFCILPIYKLGSLNYGVIRVLYNLYQSMMNKYSLPEAACLFILLPVSFEKQKCVMLTVNLSISSLIDFAFDVTSKKYFA